MEADMKPNLSRLDVFLAVVMLVALAFISWQVNQTAHAMAALTAARPHIPFTAPTVLSPSPSSHLRPVPFCDGGDRAQNDPRGDGAEGDNGDDGPDADEPEDPSQDVFPT
jgi:hypothetical protein